MKELRGPTILGSMVPKLYAAHKLKVLNENYIFYENWNHCKEFWESLPRKMKIFAEKLWK